MSEKVLPLKWMRVVFLGAILSASMFPNAFLSERRLSRHARADTAAQALPFSQNWADTGLISTDDNWNNVPGVIGYQGDRSGNAVDVDPQTVLADNASENVIANQTNPNGLATGGVAEFQIANATVAFQGSQTADAPNIVITLNTTGKTDIAISYNLRDIDGSTDNAAQQVALQYRVGGSGDYTNIPEAYIADATTGPGLATLVTPVNVSLPPVAANKPVVQLRLVTTNAAGNDEWVGIDDIRITAAQILLIELESFTATECAGGSLLAWRTGLEADNLGFNIYREDEGMRSRVNRRILAGSALFAGPGVTMGAGRSYSFHDPAPSRAGTRYFLEEIALDGTSIYHGPATVDAALDAEPDSRPGLQAAPLSMLASSADPDEGTKLVEPRARIGSGSPAQLDTQARLAGSPAIKLMVKEEGLYRVSRQQLASAGMRADARRLGLYVDGIEQPIRIVKQRGASFQAIEFYGRGLDDYSSTRRVYWLAEGDRAGSRIESVAGGEEAGQSTSFLCEVERRDRTVYFSGLRNGEAENFFGAVIARDPVEQNIRLSRVERSSGKEASVEVALQGVTLNHHRVRVEINGEDEGRIDFDGQQLGVLRIKLPQSLLREGDNSVRLVSESTDTAVSLVDRIAVGYWREYRAEADELRFTVESGEAVKVSGFSGGRIRVLDVSDELSVKAVKGEVMREGAEYSIKVGGDFRGPRRLLAYAEGREKAVEEVKRNEASHLTKPAPGADYVVISHADMKNGIAGLKQMREREGLKVESIDVEDLYDEYSFGHKSAAAIRRFLEYASASWATKPGYVLLVGDGSFDPKGYLGKAAGDFIPAKMVDTARLETASDEWYVEGAGAPIAIGRLAVRSAAEAATMAEKIERYEQGPGSQGERRGVLLVSDSEEGDEFEAASERIKVLVGGGAEEISRGRMGSGAAKDELMWAIARGQKLVNYIGHGSVDLWRGDVMTGEDARRLGNRERLSVYVLMTCLNGYFADAAIDSLAESLMKAEGGAALVWASSGMAETRAHEELNEEFYRELFAREGVRIGDAAARAKARVKDGDAKRTWVLLGDPATRLR
ncbi:MAG TPA: C25 family cysteine peptidase [Blastocatellia bacterium]|jgi:hypothetical protein|nr:C25 family cysteine peptidase [Blastocatellia bacterium]